ncbi:hypothetical protein BHE74_00040008 [Ensete ventricosum]|nr:hypothetical protein BHE74_00040008 [Ensete ventricosum]
MMLPLRFPNSGIRAKRGKRVAGHGQALYKGGWPRPSHLRGGGCLWLRPPVGAAAYCVTPAGATACSAVPTRSGGRLWAQRSLVGLQTRWPREAAPPARRGCHLRAATPCRGQRLPLAARSIVACATAVTTVR